METITSIQTIQDLIQFYPYYTFDYCGYCKGEPKPNLKVDIEIPNPNCPEINITGTLILFKNLADFQAFIYDLATTLDLTKGGDDQYYDYNPSQLEAALLGLHLIPNRSVKNLIQGYIEKSLKAIIQDPNHQDDDEMVPYYKVIQKSLSSGEYLRIPEFNLIYQLLK